MAYKEWSNKYNVSVKKFNDEHKELFNYINQLHQGLVSGFGISEMSFILNGLVNYTVQHFKNEEKLMIKHKYPEYESHKKEHTSLIEQVNVYVTEFENGKRAFSLELLNFLNEWISNHILKTDMKYKQFFKQIALNQKKTAAIN